MEVFGTMKVYTLEEKMDEHFGTIGTARRDAFEALLNEPLPEKIVGSNIKQARTRQHLTKEALAEKVGVSKATISRFENGHSISHLVALRIYEALGFTLTPPSLT